MFMWSARAQGILSDNPLEPGEGEPRQPNKAYSGLLGPIGPYWEDLAPLP